MGAIIAGMVNKEKRKGRGLASRGPAALLTTAWQLVRQAPSRLLLLTLAAQLLVVVVALPAIAWIFREALRANGMLALDTDAMQFNWGFSVTVLLLFIIFLLIQWLVLAQLGAFLLLLAYPGDNLRQLFRRVWKVSRKAFNPHSWMMILYAVVILPLSGYGFLSSVIQWVKVPNFITGELQKDPLMRTLLTIGVVLLAYVNIRLSLAIPIFTLTKSRGNEALRQSWHATRGLAPWTLIAAGMAISFGMVLAGTVIFYATLFPTWVADMVTANGSYIVAGLSLGFAHIFSLLLVGLVIAFFSGVLVAYLEKNTNLLDSLPRPQAPTSKKKTRNTAIAAVVVSGIVLGLLQIPVLKAMLDHPETVVIAHRGFVAEGVENSIEAMEAANAVGAEIVELDAMRTADGQFVVIHDPNIRRLAGVNKNVKDLTLDELTQITIHDQSGHTAKIPSLVDYVARANELGQPLLIEVKLGGGEPPAEQNVADLIAALEENDLLEGHLFHTLDHASAEALKTQLPDQTVGYIMPFAGVGVPSTSANFLVLEEDAATPQMQKMVRQAGLGYVVWTVDDPEQIRLRMRQGVDAIITDHADRALELRDAIQEQSGLAGKLHDVALSFITVF